MIRFSKVVHRRSAVLGLALTCFGALSLIERTREAAPSAAMELRDFPHLFVAAPTCPGPQNSHSDATRLEELGLLRADRYAYDPRDGVIAVRRFGEAAACYRAAGAKLDAARAERAARTMSLRVNTDYAAARLSLLNALEKERWSDALGEIRRLLLLTEHMRRHDYVEWLEKNLGLVAARAGSAS